MHTLNVQHLTNRAFPRANYAVCQMEMDIDEDDERERLTIRSATLEMIDTLDDQDQLVSVSVNSFLEMLVSKLNRHVEYFKDEI